MPVLTMGDLKLVQSISIARFLAKRFHLVGTNDMEQAQCDVVVDTCKDLLDLYVNKVFKLTEDQKEGALKIFLAEDVPKHMENLEKLSLLYGTSGHCVGNSLTWADLMVFDIYSIIQEKSQNLMNIKFEHIEKIKKTVEDHPNISAYLKSRPETPF
jgi:glutathione S-transferase